MICRENIVNITLLYLDKSCLFNNNYAYKYIFFQVYLFLGSLGVHLNALKSRAMLCVEDKIFTPHDFISLASHTTSILSWILGKFISKPKRAHIYTK